MEMWIVCLCYDILYSENNSCHNYLVFTLQELLRHFQSYEAETDDLKNVLNVSSRGNIKTHKMNYIYFSKLKKNMFALCVTPKRWT